MENKMPDIDVIAKVVANGVVLVDKAELTAKEAANLVNKGKKSGLVDDYIREYITKSIAARENGTVTLDSSGERTGRVEKIIIKVAEILKFQKPTFVYKFSKEKVNKQGKDNATNIEEMLNELLTRVKNIESFLNCQLTHWEDAHKEATENNKKMNEIDYMDALNKVFGTDNKKEAAQ